MMHDMHGNHVGGVCMRLRMRMSMYVCEYIRKYVCI